MKMKSWMQALVAGLVLAVCAGQAGAESFTFEGRNVEVPMPAGFCKLEDTGKDAVLRKALHPGPNPDAYVLMVVMDCKARAQAHEDMSRLNPFSFGSVALVTRNGTPALTTESRSGLVARVSGTPAEREEVRKRVEAWMREDGRRDPVGRTESEIGDADVSGVYLLAMVTNETKLWRNRMVQTMGMTYANGLGLTILINDPVDARSTLAGILAEQKRNLAAMVAANSP